MVAVWTRPTSTNDHGRFVSTPVIQDAALQFRFHAAGANERLIGQRLGAEVSHVGYTDPGYTIKRDDRIAVDGRDFLVIAEKPTSRPDHHQEWLLQEEQYGQRAV
jgi:hypothetical protein